MTYLRISHLTSDPGVGGERRFTRAVRTVSSFFEILAAAARVSRAVEARREPARSDLQVLGVNEKLPMAW